MSPKTIEDTRQFVEMTAKHQNWRLNNEEQFLNGLVAGLTKNFNRFDYYQCPCRASWDGQREKDRDIICPCEYSWDDIREYGQCLCGLFLSPQFAASGRSVRQIPERRGDARFP